MNFSNDKHIIIPVCLAIAAIIGYRSWQDLHPPAQPPRAYFDTYDLVRDGKTLAAFTTDDNKDRTAIFVWAGDFQTGKDGKPVLHAAPVAPVSLPQREVILMYTMDAMPKSTSALAASLLETTEKWKDQGDVVNDIYIDGPDDKKGLTVMLEQCNELRLELHNDYWIGIFLSRKALEALPDPQKQLAEASKSVRTIIFNAKDALKPGEKLEDMIQKLDSYEMPFLLQVDEIPDYTALQQALTPVPKRFGGFVIDADKIRKTAP